MRGRPEKRQANGQRPAPTDADPGPPGRASARSSRPSGSRTERPTAAPPRARARSSMSGWSRSIRAARECSGSARRGIRPGRSRGHACGFRPARREQLTDDRVCGCGPGSAGRRRRRPDTARHRVLPSRVSAPLGRTAQALAGNGDPGAAVSRPSEPGRGGWSPVQLGMPDPRRPSAPHRPGHAADADPRGGQDRSLSPSPNGRTRMIVCPLVPRPD